MQSAVPIPLRSYKECLQTFIHAGWQLTEHTQAFFLSFSVPWYDSDRTAEQLNRTAFGVSTFTLEALGKKYRLPQKPYVREVVSSARPEFIPLSFDHVLYVCLNRRDLFRKGTTLIPLAPIEQLIGQRLLLGEVVYAQPRGFQLHIGDQLPQQVLPNTPDLYFMFQRNTAPGAVNT